MGEDMNQTKEQGGTLIVDDPATKLAKRYQVILFNDETHAMDQVANQIIKAIHCTQAGAFAIMMEAHTKGRAPVILDGLERCEHVSAILEEIRLGTKIEEV